MRTIKFRGKQVDNGKWVYGSLVIQPDGEAYIIQYDEQEFNDIYGMDGEEHYIVDPETVGQYTGLEDKNGKKIYEGDVISIIWDSPLEKSEAEIIYSEDEFGWNYISSGCKHPRNPLLEIKEEDWEIEVIGNIHE